MTRALRFIGAATIVWLLWGASATLAADAYFRVSVDSLPLVDGKLDRDYEQTGLLALPDRIRSLRPYAVLDGAGEVYWQESADDRGESQFWGIRGVSHWGELVARLPEGSGDCQGKLFFPKPDGSGMQAVTFQVPAMKASQDYRKAFLAGRLSHYQRLLLSRSAGTAWFRHQENLTSRELNDAEKSVPENERQVQPRILPNDLDDTYDLFSGGRAVSENLQLDRSLIQGNTGRQETVKLDAISGITIAEIDWKAQLADKMPKLDPLATLVPADQHVIFFPTFTAAMRMLDEANEQSTPILQSVDPQSEDRGVSRRYERQIGLSATTVGRLLGPQMISSMALTGGDPYVQVGTDIALLFQASASAEALEAALAAQIQTNSVDAPGLECDSGEFGGATFRRWLTPDRAVSSYLARMGDAVIVTNSRAQLERLIRTHAGDSPALASLDEFKFFRDRYKLGEESETAFLFLSDATIRRWCSPRWRIADSRRTRDLAVLADLQAANVPKLAQNKVEAGPLHAALPLAWGGELSLSPAGVRSSVLGSLEFATPISELPLTEATKAEAESYERWRGGYENNFQWAFDPIGLRFTADDERLGADLTVMPLIGGSDYNDMIAISRGAALKPTSGDPHDAIVHGVLALNRESEQLKRWAGMGQILAPQLKVDPLSWIGDSVALYVDDDPIFDVLAKAKPEDAQRMMEQSFWKAPVALHVEVSNALKAAAFLAGLRAFIEQTAPGMTRWENLTHAEQTYVKISPTPGNGPRLEDGELAIYYAVSPTGLTLSLNENVIQRAVERRVQGASQAADDQKPAAAAASSPWLGENVALNIGREARDKLRIALFQTNDYYRAIQTSSWSNLPILNEWRRLFPDQDPVKLHERLWGVRLVCPGGGQYVWNDAWRTMESTAYGCPAEPKDGPRLPALLSAFENLRFGLTFEPHGLRARLELQRDQAPAAR